MKLFKKAFSALLAFNMLLTSVSAAEPVRKALAGNSQTASTTKTKVVSMDIIHSEKYTAIAEDISGKYGKVYGNLVQEYNMDAPEKITLTLKEWDDDSKITSWGNGIGINVKYLEKHPEDYDAIVPLLMIEVMQYNANKTPFWLVMGIAQFARDEHGLNNEKAGWELPTTVSKDQYYADSNDMLNGAFVKWLNSKYKDKGIVKSLVAKIAKDEYTDDIWKELTKKDLDELWEDFSGFGPKVTVYEHENYCGYSAALSEGKYDMEALEKLGMVNDSISSIRVPDGYKVTFYKDDKFKGNDSYTAVSLSNVTDKWNDQISSIIISKK